eukprot:4565945-Amphidinium_carterae.1
MLCRTLLTSLGVYAWRAGLGIGAISRSEKLIATSVRAGPRDWIPTTVLQNMSTLGWSQGLPPMCAL